jgi:glucose-6-phosphate isomerase
MPANPLPDETAAFAALRALAARPEPRIIDLFRAEPDRLDRMAGEVAGIYFDWSKLALDRSVLDALERLAQARDLFGWRSKLAAGAVVNPSEGRAATHMDLRAPGGRTGHQPMFRVADAVRDGGFGAVRDVIHIGIGGSALGPHLLIDALGAGGDGPRVHVAANIDGLALERAMAVCDPAATLVIAVSKTFTTQETLTNLGSACRWMEAGGVAEPMARVIAVTAYPDRAQAHGIRPDAVLDFADSVGGRYSLWSAVGLPLAIRCGTAAFVALLDGAHAMDRHFLDTGLERNLPVLAGMADIWAATFRGKATRGLFAYDERLRLLPSYLQQLEMESNGKSVSADGRPLSYPTAAITWGGTGTDAQHAVFQLLHQGTHSDPVEFVAVTEAGDRLDPIHHRLLLANCFAQGAALLGGRSFEQALDVSKGDRALAAARVLPGNRGSSTLLIDRLSPDRLGALIAFYEARVFVFATLLGINPFDQWGVELGKEVANALASGSAHGFDPSTAVLMQRAGIVV